MMSDEETSKRQARKAAREGAHKLRSDVAWTSAAKVDPMQKLRELDQEARGERVYDESTECQACIVVRVSSGDDTALCETHLADAMGF